MRKLMMCLVVLLYISPCAYALEMETEMPSFSEIIFSIQKWEDILMDKTSELPAQDDAHILRETIEQMLDCTKAVFMKAADVNGSLALPKRIDAEFPSVLVLEEMLVAESREQFLPEMGALYSATLSQQENFLLIDLSAYYSTGEMIGTQRLKMAVRDEQLLVQFIDYDNVLGATGRFAMLPNENEGRVIFTKTFGRILDVVLNVEAWKNGEEIPEWSKDLLLPIEARYLH